MALAGVGSVKGSGGGFLVRDVAANSDFHRFSGAPSSAIPELHLKLTSECIESSNHLRFRGRLEDTAVRDRAVTLVFALPIDALGWKWGDDIRRQRLISGQGEFANTVAVRAGSTGTQSVYPLAAVWTTNVGLAIALDMAKPAVYRVGYHAGLKVLFIAYDFGLVPETRRWPSAAEFEFVIYRFEGRHGFRGAWEKFTGIFPSHFEVRSVQQGTWMPFTAVSKVPGWQDFGFRYHEGNNDVAWDDTNGVLSFRYTEPMTWWMRMSNGAPRNVETALRVRDDPATGKDVGTRRMAEVSRIAAMHDEDGQPAMQFQDTPWCNGAVWSLCPNPFLGPTEKLNGATIHWSSEIKERLYGAGAKGHLDGEYLDSLEGYVTADLNFRRDHFAATSVPLSFDRETKRPALFKGLAVFEFTKWIADDVHHMGKLMFANGVPYRFTYLAPWLDVLGTETDWLRQGRYQPASLSQMDLWRTLSGGKPYLLLMNTDYDRFTPELVEKYFDRCLFYGMWPGFFSHNASENPYWQNPKWFERDRPLFRRYIPLIRQVAQAGWQPIPGATSDNPRVLVERFGHADHILLTAYNDTTNEQTATIMIEPTLAQKPQVLFGRGEIVDRQHVRLTLPPARTAVISTR